MNSADDREAVDPAPAVGAGRRVGWLEVGVAAVAAVILYIAVVTALALLGLSWPVAALIDPLVSNAGEVQQSYWDTTAAGPAAVAGAVLLGGLLTPLGEEVLFRGVLASFLFRWAPGWGWGSARWSSPSPTASTT